MGNSDAPIDCPLCGDTNARRILMMRSYTYVCPDPLCPNFCPDRKKEVDALFESSDELDFLAGGDEDDYEIYFLPPSLTD